MLPIFSNVKYDRDTALALTRFLRVKDFYLAVQLHLRLTPNLGQNALCPDFYLAISPPKSNLPRLTNTEKNSQKWL